MKKFCPKCGKEDVDFYKGFCIDCYGKMNVFLEAPGKIEITKCGKCERWFYKGRWVEDSYQQLKRIIFDKIKTNLIKPKIEVDTENDFAIVNISGYSDPLKQNKAEFERKIKINYIGKSCEKDFKISNRTFEYKIQLRKKEDFFDFNLYERIIKFIKKEVEYLERKMPDYHVFWFKENKDGIDFFFGFKEEGDHVVTRLKTKYKLDMKRSASLVGFDKGTGKYRYKQTFCLRV